MQEVPSAHRANAVLKSEPLSGARYFSQEFVDTWESATDTALEARNALTVGARHDRTAKSRQHNRHRKSISKVYRVPFASITEAPRTDEFCGPKRL